MKIQSLRCRAISWDEISKSYPFKANSLCRLYHEWRKSKNQECSTNTTFHNLDIWGNRRTEVWDTNVDYGTALHLDASGADAIITTTKTNNAAAAKFELQEPWHLYTAENVLLHNPDVSTETTTPNDMDNLGKGSTSFNRSHTSTIHTMLNPL